MIDYFSSKGAENTDYGKSSLIKKHINKKTNDALAILDTITRKIDT